MWGRIVEMMLGLWLVVSPFIFGHYPADRPLWLNDLICGAAIFLLAALSFWTLPFCRVLRYAHVDILAVGGWLIGFGYFHGGYPASPGYQNDILLGLTVILLAIIPNQASQPPPSWRRHFAQQAASENRYPES
jgi:hypothetical protein